MKAFMVNSLTGGGAERVVLNLYNELRTQNKDVILICLIKNNAYKIEDDERIIYLSNQNSFKRGFGITKLFTYIQVIFRLLKVIKKHNIELIQSHLFSASIINVIARKLGGKHKIQIVNHVHISHNGLSDKIKFISLKYTYNSADLIISICKKMKAEIDQTILKGKKNVKHIVVFNPHNIQEVVSKSLEPLDFPFDSLKTYLISVSRLSGVKRVDILIQAFEKVRKSNPNVELLILGEGVERKKLETLVDQLQIRDFVHFIGFVSNPFKYIAKSDIFVMTSECEGLPNVLFESMLCKTKIVSTDCPTGPREILAPASDFNKVLTDQIEIGGHGILCPMRNIGKIAEAINYSIDMKSEDTRKMIDEGYSYASSFSIEKVADIYFKNMQ